WAFISRLGSSFLRHQSVWFAHFAIALYFTVDMTSEPKKRSPEKNYFAFICATVFSLPFVFLNRFAIFLFPLFVLDAVLVLFFIIIAWIKSPIYCRMFLM